MIDLGVLGELLCQNYQYRSRLEAFIKTRAYALVSRILNSPDKIAPVAAFAKQRVIDAVKKELNSESKLTKEILSLPGRCPSASGGTTLDEEFKARRLGHRQHEEKDRRTRDRSVEFHDKRTRRRRSSSLSF